VSASEGNTEDRRCAGAILLRLSNERGKGSQEPSVVKVNTYFNGVMCDIKENRVTLKN
jgi:hypothetical protein